MDTERVKQLHSRLARLNDALPDSFEVEGHSQRILFEHHALGLTVGGQINIYPSDGTIQKCHTWVRCDEFDLNMTPDELEDDPPQDVVECATRMLNGAANILDAATSQVHDVADTLKKFRDQQD